MNIQGGLEQAAAGQHLAPMLRWTGTRKNWVQSGAECTQPPCHSGLTPCPGRCDAELQQGLFKDLWGGPQSLTSEQKVVTMEYTVLYKSQIALAMDKELTNWQDSAPDWLSKSSGQLVI